MATNEDSSDSLPYIDDTPTDDESTPQQYNLKITEKYHNKNRNIEITNRFPSDVTKYFPPVVPQMEERQLEDLQEVDQLTPNGMKLVIKGWNSSISIQGLDNKSSITFKRRCEKTQKKERKEEERINKGNPEESKPRRGRWKMLTKSLMLARSARFERRGLDERYPKYVLLKNEEEEIRKEKENYPKMFVIGERKQKTKSEFNFKKSFKNKTGPIVPLEEILTKNEEGQNRSNESKSKQRRNVMIKKRVMVERKKSIQNDQPGEPTGCPPGFVCNEIQGIFEDTLKLQNVEPPQHPDQPLPPQFCQIPCHNPYYCFGPPGGPTIPVYPPHKHTNSNTQTCENAMDEAVGEDLDNLPFRILSSFFPRVVIMNTIQNDDLGGEERKEGTSGSDDGYAKPGNPDRLEDKIPERLQIPEKDLTLKSKLVQQPKTEPEDSILSDISLRESSDDDLKTKTQESEVTTEYLQYSEYPDTSGNESIDRQGTPPPKYETKEKPNESLSLVEKYKIRDEIPENLTLTKIGYKMYDNLTKLSLNREKDTTKRADVSGCGCNGNETKKSPYNITFESSNSIVKVTVPEKELNFQIVNSKGGDIQIGVERGGKEGGEKEKKKEEVEEGKEEEKKIVRREELWHSDGGGRGIVLAKEDIGDAEYQKLKVSLGDNKDVILSIEMSDRDKKREKTKEKCTKEIKVGTDDFDLAGGDFASSGNFLFPKGNPSSLGFQSLQRPPEHSQFFNLPGGGYQNLSPRIGRLLKHLHEKLESDHRERKFLDEKINKTLLQQEGMLPALYLVKHISPRNQIARKSSQVPSSEKTKKITEKQDRTGQLREYYCEECLATMRIFEDENPSVKSMVDKFETIIQLESY